MIVIANFFWFCVGANVLQKNSKGFSTLITAAFEGHADVIEYLLSKGAAVNETAMQGVTPLLVAVQGGKIDAVKVLLDHGADITKADSAGTETIPTTAND